MDIIIASSRGKGLEELIKKKHPSPDNIKVFFESSASLTDITEEAKNIITRSSSPENMHIYIIGGYCNLTEVIQYKIHLNNGRRARYQEFVFQEDPESAVPRLTSLLQKTAEEIANKNALPILCTIPPSHLQTWNLKRLGQRMTCTLKLQHEYPDMQKNLINAIVDINKSIVGINKTHNTHTPKLADTILKKRGRGRAYHLYEKRLSDGVHATPETRQLWADEILTAITKNRAPKVPLPIAAPVQSDSESDLERGPCKRVKFSSERKF